MTFFKRKAEVLDHWHNLIPSFNTSVQDFYRQIEHVLKERRVPDLEIHRIDWNEGGLLSAKRQYLRLTRERLVFDICAAPFGSAFFFSCRFAEIPAVINPVAILCVVILGLMAVSALVQLFGIVLGFVAFFTIAGISVYVLRNAAAIGLANLDRTLIRTPLLGPLYERAFRKETYYRTDTRIMYVDTVPSIVKEVVNELIAAKGISLPSDSASNEQFLESATLRDRAQGPNFGTKTGP